MKVIKIEGKKALVGNKNHSHSVDLSLLKDVKTGDYLLVHGEMAINVVAKDDAEKILNFLEEK